ncbi:hypothetical protein L596_026959 [Steinernema carpocapsae]|uniref:G-protein coupled receptors family 1 profile domain-containing protein n=1 Tax=Steinernema carpocapsae TaxID=34508 RepID=A0A4U5M322_STECR|nr:hypothetical protein L596_026959 [Steinernema carpocapsae]
MTLSNSTVNFYFELVKTIKNKAKRCVQIGGGFNCVGLFGRPMFLLILALNRCFVIMNVPLKKTTEAVLFKVLLCLAVVLCFGYFSWRMTHTGRSFYLLEYDIFKPHIMDFSLVIKDVTITADMAAIFLACFLYLSIVVHIIYQRRKSCFIRARSTDLPVILQGFITLGHVVVVRCGAGNVYDTLLHFRAANIGFIVWLEVMSMINPIFYLVFVESLRNSFKEFLGLQFLGVIYVKRSSISNTDIHVNQARRISRHI